MPHVPGRERVLLHTEVSREHLVVSPGMWTLSGLLDFEAAMTGNRAYEFASAGLLVPSGDPRLLGRSFDPGNCPRTRSCTRTTTCPSSSTSSPPRPSPPWTPWPRPGSAPPRVVSPPDQP
ncbi:MAG TPA: phosphotransferase [Trebonia sp.]|nr:phosphotransferase [Trebonia sp.]